MLNHSPFSAYRRLFQHYQSEMVLRIFPSSLVDLSERRVGLTQFNLSLGSHEAKNLSSCYCKSIYTQVQICHLVEFVRPLFVQILQNGVILILYSHCYWAHLNVIFMKTKIQTCRRWKGEEEFNFLVQMIIISFKQLFLNTCFSSLSTICYK